MSNERSPNDEELERVSESGDLADPNTTQQIHEENGASISDLPRDGQKDIAAEVAFADSKTSEEELSSSPDMQQREEGGIAEEDNQHDDSRRQVTELDTAKQRQTTSTMSPEQILLLQLLRRAKRQQELVIEVQKSLKPLTIIQKSIEKIGEQVRQLQSNIKDSQKEIARIQRRIESAERAQEKQFEKLRLQKRAAVSVQVRGKASKNTKKRKKLR
ncbi:MAG TPA: hypothetical protein VHF28_05345 [Nitrososphaera sp.]|nr:hypothetical protein [Nitrososphaera sp.]